MLQLFLHSVQVRSPMVLEVVSRPCLKVLQLLVKPELAASRKNKVSLLQKLYCLLWGILE